MRRDIVWEGAHHLRYEIREIVDVAQNMAKMGIPITWENIGDPVQKGEIVPQWIRDKVAALASDSSSYSYTATAGALNTREYLAKEVNKRGGAQISSDDILFFNGLGDAVATIFSMLKREARVLGPSPAYSTLSSAEASHSGYAHTTYNLIPENNWMPDLDDIENKVKYNDSIAGILLINPDNPTGAVYSREILEKIVAIAKKYDLFVICDETYAHIVYNGTETLHLSEVIGDVPGMALRSISKEFPWPGGRCGWVEFFNKDKDQNFARFAKVLLDAKRLQVCSTSLPQIVLPEIYGDPRFLEHLKTRNTMFEKRAHEAVSILNSVEGIKVVEPRGAFYLTILFDQGVLNSNQTLPISNEKAAAYVKELTVEAPVDKRFVYYLLASYGICVVPLTGFCSELTGFRMTLLETDDVKRKDTFERISRAIGEYLKS